MEKNLKRDLLNGAYWLIPPKIEKQITLVSTGVMIEEVNKLVEELKNDEFDIAVLIVVSPDKIYRDWEKSKCKGSMSYIESILKLINKNSSIITLIDGHSSSLAWLGSVCGHKVYPMGVKDFGKSGDLDEVYEYSNIDFKSIVDSIAKLIVNY